MTATVQDVERVTYLHHTIVVRERSLDILDPEGRLLIEKVRWTLSTARNYIVAYLRVASAASTAADCHAPDPEDSP